MEKDMEKEKIMMIECLILLVFRCGFQTSVAVKMIFVAKY